MSKQKFITVTELSDRDVKVLSSLTFHTDDKSRPLRNISTISGKPIGVNGNKFCERMCDLGVCSMLVDGWEYQEVGYALTDLGVDILSKIKNNNLK
jgi:hypothetical protein